MMTSSRTCCCGDVYLLHCESEPSPVSDYMVPVAVGRGQGVRVSGSTVYTDTAWRAIGGALTHGWAEGHVLTHTETDGQIGGKIKDSQAAGVKQAAYSRIRHRRTCSGNESAIF